MAPSRYLTSLELCSRLNIHHAPASSPILAALSPTSSPSPNSVSRVFVIEGTLAGINICGHFASPNISQIPCHSQACGGGRGTCWVARPGSRGLMMWGRGYGMEVRKSPNGGSGGSPDVLGLKWRECNPKEAVTGGARQRGRGALGWLHLAEERQDGARGSWPRRDDAGVTPGWSGHSELPVPWRGELCKSEALMGEEALVP